MNEPPSVTFKDGSLITKTASETDFWQKTFLGFQMNNGHALLTKKSGDFTMETHCSFKPHSQYDQTGLIVYYSEEFWLKAPIEYDQGDITDIGAVVTNFGYSDWSIQETHPKDAEMYLKIERKGNDFFVYARPKESEKWQQLRICHLHIPEGSEIKIGLFCASAKEGGFESKFDYISID